MKCATNLRHTGWVFEYYYYYLLGGTKSLSTAATSGLLYKLQMINEDDCGAIGGMKIGRGNQITRRKPAAAPLCLPQIPHDQTRARTPGRRGGKPATNRLSYGADLDVNLVTFIGLWSCWLPCRFKEVGKLWRGDQAPLPLNWQNDL
jgi:hypothetical protein